MSNPTGTNLTASVGANIDRLTGLTYVWADGDDYEIAQTDAAEGAASGASFAGLGVLNQPHAILLYKVNLVRGAQLADEANITALTACNAWTNMQVFEMPGTFPFTTPAAILRFIVIGGGAGSINTSGGYTSGGGGGAGGYVEGIFDFGLGVALAVTIGAPGSGGGAGASGTAGGASGISIVSSGTQIATVTGGFPGMWGGGGLFSAGGGGGSALVVPAAGVGFGGGAGSDGQAIQAGYLFTIAGNGADGRWGGGGRAADAMSGVPIQNGAAPGAGGGGFYGGSGSGGSGAQGVVIFYW